MLKIKDSVDLKELEKFGFNFVTHLGSNWYEKIVKVKKHSYYDITVFLQDRKIMTRKLSNIKFRGLWHTIEKDVHKHKRLIKDLIKAGLVEKVEEL